MGEPGGDDPAAQVRLALLDDSDEAGLHRAIASGRQRGREPRWRRVELRYVDLKAGRRLQVTAYDDTQAFTSNHDPVEAPAAIDALLEEGFAAWHVETATGTLQARVTKKGRLLVHRTGRPGGTQAPDRSHDRAKQRLLPEDDPVLRELGITDAQGRVKPSRQAKYRQVEELLRALDAALADAQASGAVRTPSPEDPLRVVDLGCGNAYLTFSAHRYLTSVLGLPVHTTGVDVKAQSREHNTAVAERLGLGEVTFVQAGIDGWTPDQRPDVVLALHACDTATDDALAQAVRWDAPLVLAAPCCHHDLSAQLREVTPPPGHAALLRDGILRERFADTLTDAVRALLLRTRGYRTDVVEFVDSAHTPRNTLLRAVRTGADGGEAQSELDTLLAQWPVRPALAERLR